MCWISTSLVFRKERSLSPRLTGTRLTLGGWWLVVDGTCIRLQGGILFRYPLIGRELLLEGVTPLILQIFSCGDEGKICSLAVPE